jgi:hypothetical protein
LSIRVEKHGCRQPSEPLVAIDEGMMRGATRSPRRPRAPVGSIVEPFSWLPRQVKVIAGERRPGRIWSSFGVCLLATRPRAKAAEGRLRWCPPSRIRPGSRPCPSPFAPAKRPCTWLGRTRQWWRTLRLRSARYSWDLRPVDRQKSAQSVVT